MICPLCDCPDWSSIEKNKDGVNLWVQCHNCRWIYRTRFGSNDPIEYRLADAISAGRMLEEVKASDVPSDAEFERIQVDTFKLKVKL